MVAGNPPAHAAGAARRAYAVIVAALVLAAACSTPTPHVAVFDPAASIKASLSGRTVQFSTTTTIDAADSSPRQLSMAMGVVDLVSVTGVLEGTITQGGSPSSGAPLGSVHIEARTVDGHGVQRKVGTDDWRNVDGGLGSFLQLGNDAIAFDDAMNRVFSAVGSWRHVGEEVVSGASTNHYAGTSPSGRGVEAWIDDLGRFRRVRFAVGSGTQSGTEATIVLEMWDYGVIVNVQLPT
jgi:hypothetical protein